MAIAQFSSQSHLWSIEAVLIEALIFIDIDPAAGNIVVWLQLWLAVFTEI